MRVRVREGRGVQCDTAFPVRECVCLRVRVCVHVRVWGARDMRVREGVRVLEGRVCAFVIVCGGLCTGVREGGNCLCTEGGRGGLCTCLRAHVRV